MSEIEQAKLYQYIKEASYAQEARLYHLLDCSAFCLEDVSFVAISLQVLKITKYSLRV